MEEGDCTLSYFFGVYLWLMLWRQIGIVWYAVDYYSQPHALMQHTCNSLLDTIHLVFSMYLVYTLILELVGYPSAGPTTLYVCLPCSLFFRF